MNRIATGWLCALLLCVNGPAFGEEFFAKVIVVLDGDTVLVRREGGLVKVRLAEIDAPEKAQAFGEASRRSLSGMVLGKQVKIVGQATDQYGRMIAHLGMDGLDVNAEQIRRGMAWEYSNFHSDQVLIALQNEARRAASGLWAQSNPTPPWEWRKRHPGTISAQPDAAASSVAARTGAVQHDPDCGGKKHCSEMTSCAEALYYFSQCAVETLDGDGDGVPCKKLCTPEQN